jgi:hypothetical protein
VARRATRARWRTPGYSGSGPRRDRPVATVRRGRDAHWFQSAKPETALALGATHIVTGDHALLRASVPGVTIVGVAEFIVEQE